ncbi:tetratricopeptide repeat protein [Streptomyces sp. NPDC001914]|uniref:tetratricopeptide repeat protein n=1 Tax=Streptomyces sp. NPDC001914 TaxID=3364623 RepID=UPI00369F9169
MARFGPVAAENLNIAQVVMSGQANGFEGDVTLAPPVGDRDWRIPLRGREELVTRLTRLWQEPADGLVHVLHGMSGIGKTAVVLEMVTRVRAGAGGRAPAERVFWVDGRHEAAFVSGMRAVARQMGVGTRDVHCGSVVDALWERFEHSALRWLLIVDGVEDLTLLDGPGRLSAGTGWVRPHGCPAGLVVITSACGIARLWGRGALLHAVGPLAVDEAASVLLDHSGGSAGTRADASGLARRLGGLPLALRLAASYLSEAVAMPQSLRSDHTPTDFTGFRLALDQYGSDLNPAAAVAGTWRMSVELLQRQGLVHAPYLVRVLASFSAAPIPYTLLLRPAVLSALPGGTGLDGTTVWRTLQELAALQLVELDRAAPKHEGPLCVSLHPLIRDIARAGAQSTVPVALMERVLRLKEVEEAPESPSAWPVWRALAPHCLDLLRQGRSEAAELSPAEREVCAEAAERAARFLQAQGMHRQARESLEEVLALRVRLGADDLSTATTRHSLALVLHSLGEWAAAQTLYTQVWQALSEGRGASHAHTLKVRHELGRVLLDQGQLEQAQEHLRAVRETRERIGGAEDPDALTARHELARVLHGMDRWAEAREEYEALLALQEQVSGTGHPRTVTVRHNYACLLQDMGQAEQAHEECEQALADRRALYGDDHGLTLSTRYLLAVILRARALTREARVALEDVGERCRELLGEHHPQTVRCKSLLQRWDGLDQEACPTSSG